LSEAEQKQFAVQIEQATQIGLQSSLLNALRAKAKIEIKYHDEKIRSNLQKRTSLKTFG